MHARMHMPQSAEGARLMYRKRTPLTATRRHCWLQVWKIKRFSGACEHNLRAEVSMVSTTKERKPWPRPPISMSFQVRRIQANVCVFGVICAPFL
jgi:hypothetical protein